jgi:hypothetical protein
MYYKLPFSSRMLVVTVVEATTTLLDLCRIFVISVTSNPSPNIAVFLTYYFILTTTDSYDGVNTNFAP